MPAIGSAIFQGLIRGVRNLPMGEIAAQAIWFGRNAKRIVHTRRAPSKANQVLLDQIHERGFALVPGYWSKVACQTAIAELERAFETYPTIIHRGEDRRLFGAEQLMPSARTFAQDSWFLELANDYNGGPNVVSFTMANCIEAKTAKGMLGSGGDWHRDVFLPKLKGLLYLSDVTEETGPFQILEKSHRSRYILRDMARSKLGFMQDRVHRQAEPLISGQPSRCKRLVGEAGTLVLFDTRAVHTGTPILAGARYALTNYLTETFEQPEEYWRYFAPIVRDTGEVVAKAQADDFVLKTVLERRN